MKKSWKTNTCKFVALFIWIYVRENLTPIVIGVVVYYFIDKYICIEYIAIQKE